MNSVFHALLEAYRRTGEKKYFDGAIRIANWVKKARVNKKGWAYQYTDSGRPAGARSFEPPAIGPAATRDAIKILCGAYRWPRDESLLDPIEGGIAWLKKIQLRPGWWARFYHPDSDKPWYRNAGGGNVSSAAQAKPKYTWEGNWGLTAFAAYAALMREKETLRPPEIPRGGIEDDPADALLPHGKSGGKFRTSIENILNSQDKRGAFLKRKSISGRMYYAYVHQLVRYLRGQRGRTRP